MGLFDLFKGKVTESDEWDGQDSMDCPRCGKSMTKRYSYSDWWCENCHAGLHDDEDECDDESLSVYDAADIWASHGKDEDYTFGYSEEELEEVLK